MYFISVISVMYDRPTPKPLKHSVKCDCPTPKPFKKGT